MICLSHSIRKNTACGFGCGGVFPFSEHAFCTRAALLLKWLYFSAARTGVLCLRERFALYKACAFGFAGAKRPPGIVAGRCETVEKAGWTARRKKFENRFLFFSSRKASCTLKKIKSFKSRKTALWCGFCAFCLLLGGSTAVQPSLAKYKIQLVFLAVSQRVGLYILLPLYLFRHAETAPPGIVAGRCVVFGSV